jgi:tellurite resistance protein
METMQLRAELFREMNPMLDSDEMLRKMIAYVRSLFALQQSEQQSAQKARQAIEAMRLQSEQNGNANMTLDDINKEIQQARAARKATV